MTEKEHLTAVWKMTKRKPSGLSFPDMPQEFKYIWTWYVRIANAGEVNLLTIEAFTRLMKINIKPKEVDMLLEIDLAYKRTMSESLNKKLTEPVKQQPRPESKATPKPKRRRRNK